MYRQIISKYYRAISNRTISNQHFFSTSVQLQQLNRISLNSSKCFKNLTNEHIRIYATMQSFEKMLNKIPTNNGKATVSKEQSKDIKKFMKFITNYQLHHHEKEEALYSMVIESGQAADFAVAMIKAVENEHIEMLQMSGLITSKTAINTVEITPYLSFIRSTYDHMFEESNDIFPMIQLKLTKNQMKKIDEYFEEYDYNKAGRISASKLLSDQLLQKYA